MQTTPSTRREVTTMPPDIYGEQPKTQTPSQQALDIAYRYAGCEGDHHRMWVIDQMIRALTGSEYEEWIRDYNVNGFEWDEGIAP